MQRSTLITITLEREPGAPTVNVYSENPNIGVIRDADVSDKEILIQYAEILDDVLNYKPPEVKA